MDNENKVRENLINIKIDIENTINILNKNKFELELIINGLNKYKN